MYDDEMQIVRNPIIQHWKYLPYYFHAQVWAHVDPNQPGNYYRPIFMIWMRLVDAIFGMQAWAWHLTTMLMHIIATSLVFTLARRLSRRNDIALITALFFGVHPIHIEAVAWVSGVTEPLFACLLIPAFLFFLDWREGRANARTFSFLLYALAIFSKETAVLMMPLVFAYGWIYPPVETGSLLRRFWNSLKPALPYLAITIGYLYCRFLALHGFMHAANTMPVRTNLLTIPSILWFYLKLLFLPIGLSGFYNTPEINSPTLIWFWLPLLGLVVVTSALFYWWWKTRDRLVAFAAVLMFLPFLPLMNFNVFMEGEIAHDRYLYIPSIGFSLLLALGISHLAESFSARAQPRAQPPAEPEALDLLWGRGRPTKVATFVAVVAVAYLALTVWQSQYWVNNLVLYSRGVQIAPENNLALNNLANELDDHHYYREAIAIYRKVLERKPTFYLANYNLGYVLFEDHQYQEAAYFLRRAAHIYPTDSSTYYYIAQCEMQSGQLESAEANLHRAILVDPRMLGPRYLLGILLKQQGRNREALDYFRAELEKNPNDAKSRKEVAELTGN